MPYQPAAHTPLHAAVVSLVELPYWPLAHGVGVSTPETQYEPMGQSMGVIVRVGQYVPAAQRPLHTLEVSPEVAP